MLRDITKLAQGEYDLLVIGGGINGAAVANLAAGRGMKVALLEKNDFASGTSSKSTKLIHGGIRYLENLEFDLVHESLKERYIQLKNVPHLVKPLEFIIPVYKGDKRPLWMMQFGVFLYDLIAGKYGIGKHRRLTVDELLALEPGIKKEGLAGGVMYFDAQMDDARLVLENVLSASQKGARAANYTEVVSFLKKNGKVIGVQARDVLTQKKFEVHARRTVCAAGPWANSFFRMEDRESRERLRTTKGIHIVYKGQLTRRALLVTSKEDNRVFFIIPWMGNSLIGTTDTDYTGNPDQVKSDAADVDYLLKEARRIFPGTAFKEEDIITTFAGLRPLVRQDGSPSRVSRKHVIEENYSGVIFVLGGKYTTYRQIAEDCLSKLKKDKQKSASEEYPLYGSGVIAEDAKEVAKRYSVGEDSVGALMARYGTRYQDVLRLTEKDPTLKQKICSCSAAIKAQVVYAIETEMAANADDIIWRRLGLGYLDCPTKKCRTEIDLILAKSRN